jgi:hypothetical protein
MENKYNSKKWKIAIVLISFICLALIIYNLPNGSNLDVSPQAKAVAYLMDNEITIYGSENCGWCKKQQEEFGLFIKDMKQDGLYKDCQDYPDECQFYASKILDGRLGTPFWVMNDNTGGFIIHQGYMSIDNIIPTLEDKYNKGVSIVR